MKRKNWRKGVLVPLAMGLTLAVGVGIFAGSQADHIYTQNVFFKLKNLTDKAALAGVNGLLDGNDAGLAEATAREISSHNTVYQQDLSDQLVFTWNEDELRAVLPHYRKETFWLRMVGMDYVDLNDVNSTARIVSWGGSDNTFPYTRSLKPLAINDQSLAIGDTKTFTFKIEPEWDYADKETFYGLDLYASSDNLAGADHVVKYRNELALAQSDYTLSAGESAGCSTSVNFEIQGDQVVPLEAYDATLEVLGAALTYGAGGYDLMVTAHARVGAAWQEMGSFSQPVEGNLNDHQAHTFALGEFPANTPVAIEARSWLYDGSGDMASDGNWYTHKTRNGWDGSPHIQALRNGDPIPDFAPFGDQSSIQDFIEPYIDLATGQIVLENNQVIYLFELGMDDQGSSAYDMQDLVVLVTMSQPVGSAPCENQITLLGAYLGTYTSNRAVDVGNTVTGLEDFTGYSHNAAPDNYGEDPKVVTVAILDDARTITGFVNLRIDALSYDTTGNPDNRWVRMETTVVGGPYARLVSSH